jgi:hypothetical protein
LQFASQHVGPLRCETGLASPDESKLEHGARDRLDDDIVKLAGDPLRQRRLAINVVLIPGGKPGTALIDGRVLVHGMMRIEPGA